MPSLDGPGTAFWVKRDDLTHPVYGGNKPRKLWRLLAQAEARRARRVVTFGAAGSHHVLATALFGKMLGLRVAAVITPQQRTDHAAECLRASIAQGVEPFACPAASALPRALARAIGRGDVVIPPGGSTLEGTLGYVEAARELREQLEEAREPAPSCVVVATGSGGTAAGLAAGLEREGLATQVIAVMVTGLGRAGGAFTQALAARAAARVGASPLGAASRLVIDDRYEGEGYGRPTPEGARAGRLGEAAGLTLDPTYTEKALAAALDRCALGRDERVLFWTTLSSAPLAPLLEGAPEERDLPPELASLLR